MAHSSKRPARSVRLILTSGMTFYTTICAQELCVWLKYENVLGGIELEAGAVQEESSRAIN